ncbi:hypothetical protein CP061683_1189B, partial [Chlamydia psittaci 06-1683]
LAPENQ